MRGVTFSTAIEVCMDLEKPLLKVSLIGALGEHRFGPECRSPRTWKVVGQGGARPSASHEVAHLHAHPLGRHGQEPALCALLLCCAIFDSIFGIFRVSALACCQGAGAGRPTARGRGAPEGVFARGPEGRGVGLSNVNFGPNSCTIVG